MKICRIIQNDYNNWLTMRKKLWPECLDEKHDEEMKLQLSQPDRYPVFIASDYIQDPIGFLEASIWKYIDGKPCRDYLNVLEMRAYREFYKL